MSKCETRCESQDWLIDRARHGTLPSRECRDCESLPFRERAARRSSCAEHATRHNQVANAMEYVLIASLVFGDRADAERAEKYLATTVFNGLVSSWSEVEEVRW